MNRNQNNECPDETPGKVKEGEGRVTADKSTEVEGTIVKPDGDTKPKFGELKDSIETKKNKQ